MCDYISYKVISIFVIFIKINFLYGETLNVKMFAFTKHLALLKYSCAGDLWAIITKKKLIS